MKTKSLDINTALPIVPCISQLPQWYAKRESLYPIKKDLHTYFILYSSTGKKLSISSNIETPLQGSQKTDLAILYIHGFSSSPRETSPLIEKLSSKLKANTVAIRLPRHGLSHAALSYLEYKEMYTIALEAVAVARQLGKKLIVISCSTGSTLGILLSMRSTAHKEMDMHICLSPNLGIRSKKLFFFLSFHRIQQRIIYFLSYLCSKSSKRRYSKKRNDLHEAYNTLDVPIPSYYHMLALVYLAWNLRRKNPKFLRLATYIYARQDDAVVHFARTKKYFAGMDDIAKFVDLPQAEYSHTHVIAGSASSPNSSLAMVKSLSKIIRDYQKEHP